MKMIKISFTKIRGIHVNDLLKVLNLMSAAIFGNPTTFKGVLPKTAVQLKTLADTFLDAQLAYLTGGLNQKAAYLAAWAAITDVLLEFAEYVNILAKGDLEILHLSTLPTTEDLVDYLAEIVAGQMATGITGTQGYRGQLLIECDYFAKDADYVMILSEDTPLSSNVIIDHSGVLTIPGSNLNTITITIDGARKKSIVGLTPGKLYFIYYALKYGKYVGLLSTGVEASCGH